MADPQLAMARERLGHVLKDRWVLEDVLGVGGMAAVYAARHRNGAKAAIKLLHGPLSEDQVVRERFLREAYLANSLEHIGTVHVLDDDADPKLGPFLVMELLDGSSILELLDKGVVFEVPVVLDIADQTLDVLSVAHEKGIVHRDLKPANLFLCRSGQVKVLDFGIARVLDANAARLTRTGVPLGTPAYMAPEQARGQGRDADGRADIYALGATMFRMLAGRHVHVGRGAEQIAQVATMRAPKLGKIAAHLPPMLSAVVDRSLEFEQARRYETARAMQEDVRALVRGETPPIASRPLPDPGPVPALPPLQPRKRKDSGVAPPSSEQPKPDQVAQLAESLRQRAHEIARRPDAFTVMPQGYDEPDEEEEDMATMIGTRPDMELGKKPTALADLHRPPPRRPPARPPSPSRTAAQVFAKIPNVPVPPGSRPMMMADDEAPTIARAQPLPPAVRAGIAAMQVPPSGLPQTQYSVAQPPPSSQPSRMQTPSPLITHTPSVPPISATGAPMAAPFANPFSAPSIPPAPPAALAQQPTGNAAITQAQTPQAIAQTSRARLMIYIVLGVVAAALLGMLAFWISRH
ncbi:MAG: protein kinase domain-containing protein [Polyangiales bacterium]